MGRPRASSMAPAGPPTTHWPQGSGAATFGEDLTNHVILNRPKSCDRLTVSKLAARQPGWPFVSDHHLTSSTFFLCLQIVWLNYWKACLTHLRLTAFYVAYDSLNPDLAGPQFVSCDVPVMRQKTRTTCSNRNMLREKLIFLHISFYFHVPLQNQSIFCLVWCLLRGTRSNQMSPSTRHVKAAKLSRE